MSATLSDTTINILKELFSYTKNIKKSLFPRMRPEIRFFHKKFYNSDRDKILLESLRFLPRPVIIYVTTKNDAEDLYRKLIDSGYCSTKVFHGNTKDNDRRDILNQWRNNKLEIIVATSTFGIGVDKEDIRVVVHKCFPESVDRFYQEVGRGRDGNTSISLLIPEQNEDRLAINLLTTLLSEQKIIERWKNLYENKILISNKIIKILVETKPVYAIGDTDYGEHFLWNKRLILMLSRYKFINLLSYKREIIGDDEDYKETIELECNFHPRYIEKIIKDIVKKRDQRPVKKDNKYN